MPLLEWRILKIHSFPHIFSYTLWHIELKFCILLCFAVLQIKFQCRQFPSIFLWSNTPFGTKNTENTQFSALFSYTLWHIELKFCISICFTVLQIKFECLLFALIFLGDMPLLELRIFLWELCPFWNLEYWKYTVFYTFLLRALTYLVETLHMTLFNVQKITFECHNSVSVWLSVRPSIFSIFLLHTSTYLVDN